MIPTGGNKDEVAGLSNSPREGAWALVRLKLPGRRLTPVGIMLLDVVSDTLQMRFRDLTEGEEDDDIVEFWGGFTELLQEVANESGGHATLLWLESSASHTIQVSDMTSVQVSAPDLALKALFEKHVAAQLTKPRFSRKQIDSALNSLPILPSSAIQVIAALNNPVVSLREIETAVSQDPVLAAHILRLANSAMMPFREEVRTVAAAINRIGFDLTKMHVLALTVGKIFSSNKLKQVWSHSLDAAQTARQIAKIASIPPEEATLLGLIHDVGRIALSALGKEFDIEYAQLLRQGMSSIATEEQLCGITHAQAGAKLLERWRFPADFCEAVQHHHAPTRNETPFSALLYITEASLGGNEDIYDPTIYRESLDVLGIPECSFGSHGHLDPDLEFLRAAA